MLRAAACLAVFAALIVSTGADARPKKKAPPAAAAPVQTAPAAPLAPAKPTLAALLGTDESRVKAALGLPDIARDEGAGAMWTYRWKDCAVMIFFQRADGRALRVSGAEATARRRGVKTPALDECLAAGVDEERGADATAIDALLGDPR